MPDRLLRVFLQPMKNRAIAWCCVAGTGLAIGVPDYLSGIDISFSIFYLIPISLATGWLGAGAGVVTAVACTIVRVVSDVLMLAPEPAPLHTWWNVSAAFVIFLFVVWLLHSLIALHRQLEVKVSQRSGELIESVAERERLQRDLLDISARERRAIGSELHDDLGQNLVAIALATQVLAQKLHAEEAGKAQAIVGWIEAAIAKSRKLARGLLLSAIEPQRFPQELEELAAISSHGQMHCRVVQTGGTVPADAAECAQLFRIAQEAVGNALRHAQASDVEIVLASDEESLRLSVEDNGCGLSDAPHARGLGMGLRIMEHRARSIGASFSLWSSPGRGTRILCRLPVKQPALA